MNPQSITPIATQITRTDGGQEYIARFGDLDHALCVARTGTFALPGAAHASTIRSARIATTFDPLERPMLDVIAEARRDAQERAGAIMTSAERMARACAPSVAPRVRNRRSLDAGDVLDLDRWHERRDTVWTSPHRPAVRAPRRVRIAVLGSIPHASSSDRIEAAMIAGAGAAIALEAAGYATEIVLFSRSSNDYESNKRVMACEIPIKTYDRPLVAAALAESCSGIICRIACIYARTVAARIDMNKSCGYTVHECPPPNYPDAPGTVTLWLSAVMHDKPEHEAARQLASITGA